MIPIKKSTKRRILTTTSNPNASAAGCTGSDDHSNHTTNTNGTTTTKAGTMFSASSHSPPSSSPSPSSPSKSTKGRLNSSLVTLLTVAIILHGYDQFRVLYSIDIDGSSGGTSITSSSTSWNAILQKHQASPNFNFTQLIDITCNNPSVNMLTVASRKEQISKTTGRIPKILCIVLTHSESHTTHIPIIQQTWGKKCTKLLFASDKEGNITTTTTTEDIVDERFLKHMNNRDDQSAGDGSNDAPTKDSANNGSNSNEVTEEDNNHNQNNNRHDKHSEIIRIKSEVGYWGIWDKLLQTLLYVRTNYRKGYDYDWIVKADDDTYFVMENLKAFLAKQIDLREELAKQQQQGEQQSTTTHTTVIGGSSRDFRARIIQNKENIQYFRTNLTNYTTHNDDNDVTTINNKKFYGPFDIYNEPIVFGRTMPFPKYKDLYLWPHWLSDKKNYWFGRRFNKTGIDIEGGTLIYPHGGPGYIMNWMYVDMLVDSFVGDPKSRVRGRVSEDIANAITMLYRGVTPYSTRDPSTNLERSHPEPPEIMYDNPSSLRNAQVNIENTGYGTHCCSPSSLSYHHVRPEHMKLLDYQLYECPKIMN